MDFPWELEVVSWQPLHRPADFEVKDMSTSNLQLPTPNASRAKQLGDEAAARRSATAVTTISRWTSLGSWKLGVGSCLLAATVASITLSAQSRVTTARLLKP